MKKKIIIILAVVITVFVIVYFLYDYPIVLNENQSQMLNIKDTSQVVFNPIESIDFSTGSNVAYLLFNKTDLKELPVVMSKCKLFECSNNTILQSLKKDFLFTKTSGDMATCESKMYIYKDKKLVFHSSFVFTDNVLGIQNSLVGWADAVNKENLKKILFKFKPVNKPIVKL